MWQKIVLALLYICVLLCRPKLSMSLQPAADARVYFATNFYRQLVYHSQLQSQNFVISPAAIQKLLTIIYDGVEACLADEMLWDLQLKHLDEERLFSDAKSAGLDGFTFAGDLRDLQLAALSAIIERESIVKYFEDDFNEYKANIKAKNFGIVPLGGSKFNASYVDFAKNYFDFVWHQRGDKETTGTVERIFGVRSGAVSGIELMSSLAYNGTMEQLPLGFYRYADMEYTGIDVSEPIQILELPMDRSGGLKLLLFLHKENMYLEHFLSQMLGRKLHDFGHLELNMEYSFVQMTLPALKIKSQMNLANYFAELARFGLLKLFTEPISLPSLFVDNSTEKHKVISLWQKCEVEIYNNTVVHDPILPINLDNVTTPVDLKIFNAVGKPLFFVIKSDRTIYFMGHTVN